MEQLQSNTTSLIYSNLQKAAEKQQNTKLMEYFASLSTLFKGTGRKEGTLPEMVEKISHDLEKLIPQSNNTAKAHGDRGSQRALKWGETVAKIQKSVIERYIKQGDAVFEGKNIYVCQACGFIFVGNTLPPVCAACKAPSNRFEMIR